MNLLLPGVFRAVIDCLIKAPDQRIDQRSTSLRRQANASLKTSAASLPMTQSYCRFLTYQSPNSSQARLVPITCFVETIKIESEMNLNIPAEPGIGLPSPLSLCPQI